VPAGPSQDGLELLNDPQLRHRGQLIELDHPEVGPRLHMGMQGIFSAFPERRYFPTAVYDQDNDLVFRDLLGLPQGEIDRLIAEGVIN
jgi:crotonobetainyl-CoA:carnitine CoA-transferase CaiB-like acyl-CoA transferase